MDIKRSVNTRVWADDWFENLSPAEKLLWLYLLTNSYTNMLGIYEISIKRISFETGLGQTQIENTLEAFERVRKAFYWDGFMFLPNWMKNQSMNTNMLKSAEKNFNDLTNTLITKLKENGFEGFESLSNGSVILPKKEIEIEKEIEKEIEGEKDKKITHTQFELNWIKADEKEYNYILKYFPKLLKMKHPIRPEEHNKLCQKFTAKKVSQIYGQMENKPDLVKKYDSAYLTAHNWLSRG
jgi:hypothetical protein